MMLGEDRGTLFRLNTDSVPLFSMRENLTMLNKLYETQFHRHQPISYTVLLPVGPSDEEPTSDVC